MLAITFTVIFVGTYCVDVALSFYAVRKAPAAVRILPSDLRDQSVSEAPGEKVTYVGYAFEIPWSDLDEDQTMSYPKDRPKKASVDLRFRSGLRLLIKAIPPREWANGLPKELKVSPHVIESAFGQETMKSDYSFVKTLYEFNPERMNHWAFSRGGFNRDELMLLIKSIALSKSADAGIFNLKDANYKGFQQGDPQVRQDRILVNLYSDDGSVEMILFQKDYRDPKGVTQPEINRIVQSFRSASPIGSTDPGISKR